LYLAPGTVPLFIIHLSGAKWKAFSKKFPGRNQKGHISPSQPALYGILLAAEQQNDGTVKMRQKGRQRPGTGDSPKKHLPQMPKCIYRFGFVLFL